VARHARGGRRDAGKGRCLYGSVAKTTIQSDIADMMFVAKGRPLRNGGVEGGNASNAAAPKEHKGNAKDQEQTRNELEQKHEPRPKDLSHTVQSVDEVLGRLDRRPAALWCANSRRRTDPNTRICSPCLAR